MSLVRKAILPLIVCAAAGLSLYWVFLVPIYQAPDESGHLDYAFDLYTAGRLITVREVPPAAGANSYTRYLASSIHFDDGKVERNYGTGEYFRDLDRNAPDQSAVHWTMQNQYL